MTTAEITAPALLITRIFDASPERVFDAWLSESMGAWIGPREIRGEVTLMEPKIGGRYTIVMHRADGSTLTVRGVYREIARPNKLVFTWGWEHEQKETLVTLSFRAVGGKTEMTMRHEGFPNDERRDGHNQGWNGSFDKLAAALAR